MDVTQIVLRHAVLSDAEALSKFMNTLADENLDTIAGVRTTPAEEVALFEKAAKNGRAFRLIALDTDEVIGLLGLWAGEQAHSRDAARLGMSVLSPYRGQGIGRKLMTAAIDETKKWPSFCRIELEVVPWNKPAIHLYESLGFVREGVKRKAANYGGKPTDLALMALVW